MSNPALTNAIIHERLFRMAWSKLTWLQDHGEGKSKRPEHEVIQAREDLEVLAALRDRYAERLAA